MADDRADAMTDARIDALRMNISSLHKALKHGYADALKPEASRKVREEANRLPETFRDAVKKVGEELRMSTKATENVHFACLNEEKRVQCKITENVRVHKFKRRCKVYC